MKLDFKTFLIFLLTSSFIFHGDLSVPTSLSKDLYSKKVLDGTYLKNIDHPDTFLDFGYGERVANPAQIQQLFLHMLINRIELKLLSTGEHMRIGLYTLFLSPPLPILRD